MTSLYLVLGLLCISFLTNGLSQNVTTSQAEITTEDLTNQNATTAVQPEVDQTTVLSLTSLESNETVLSTTTDKLDSFNETSTIRPNASVNSSHEVSSSAHENKTAVAGDDPPPKRKPVNTPKSSSARDYVLQMLMGQMVPELRNALKDRLNFNDDQVKKLFDFAQSLINTRNSTIPSSIEDLIEGLQNSGLFSAFNANQTAQPGVSNTTMPTMGPYTMSWPECRADLQTYFTDLATGQNWAINMLDASGKPGRSIFLGNLKFLGNYIQCNEVHHRNTTTFASVDGKVCRAIITVPMNIPGAEILTATSGGPKINWDICLPKTCQGHDLNKQLASYGMLGSVYIYCTPELDMSDDTGAIIALVILAVLGVLLFLGTLLELAVKLDANHADKPPIYDAYVNASAFLNKGFELNETSFSSHDGKGKITQLKTNGDIGQEWKPNGVNLHENGNGIHVIGAPLATDTMPSEGKKESKPRDPTASLPKWQRALLAFSIPRNTKKILGVKAAPGSIGCLHGIRVMSMGWVILGHTIVFTYIFENPLSVFKRIQTMPFQLILNATLSVDSFFLMSGLLTGYLFLKECGKKGRVTIRQRILYYVHRYWRLTPPLMIWIMVVANLIKYVGEGKPLWTDYGGAQTCRDNWWINMLYINNVYKNEESCLGVTWFLAHDMQFYFVAPMALLPWVYGQRVIGFLNAIVLIAIHLASTIWIELDINADMLRNQPDYSQQIYFKPYTRVAPFAIGLMMGWILWKSKGKVRMNKYVVAIGWLVSLGLILTLTLASYDENKHTDLQEFAEGWSHEVRIAWETLRRPLWATALAWIILACSSGYGGPINSILSWEGWLPMSRLTYSAFLVHLTILMYEGITPESTFMFTSTTLTYHFLATVVISYLVGYILAVCVEAPMLALEKVVLS